MAVSSGTGAEEEAVGVAALWVTSSPSSSGGDEGEPFDGGVGVASVAGFDGDCVESPPPEVVGTFAACFSFSAS